MNRILLIVFIFLYHSNFFGQIGTYTRAKSELTELILSNKIRVDEKINATTFNYLIQIEKVEIKADTLIIIAKPTKYKVSIGGKVKILSEGEKSKAITYKTSLLDKFVDNYPISVVLGNLFFTEPTFQEGENIKKFADNVVILRENSLKEKEKAAKSKMLDSLLLDFGLKIKTATKNASDIEKQRELMVQANVFFDQKQYYKVIALYEEAININLVSYPPIYYNLALIYALTENYQMAIYNMKRYLMVEPNAEDKAESEDKINEWKINLN
ncbi:MAG: tetratricopeptide repeat protein [Bacteroidia bacterium]|nr:tetratricopeptide repeat protein [Bacteroidia bacterium]